MSHPDACSGYPVVGTIVSGLSCLLQCFIEDVVEGSVFSHPLFDDLPRFIDVFQIDDNIDASVKGGHVV
jgi:hypothetical protein